MPSLISAVHPEDIRHGDHVCGVFGSDGEQERAVITFVTDGLAARDRVWCFTGVHPPEAVLASLRRGGVDVAGALTEGQLTVMHGQSYLAGRPFDSALIVAFLHDAVDQAVADGWAGFRIADDMTWVPDGTPGSECLFDYEQRAAEVFATRPLAALCQYNGHHFDAHAVNAAVALHPHTLVGSGLRVTPLNSLAGLRLEGEIDLSNREALKHALGCLVVGSGDVHLTLKDLHFIDVNGARTLVTLAGRLWPDRCLILHDPPPLLRRTLELAWGKVDGLEVSGS